MESFQARLETFAPKSKGSPKWPHPVSYKATPLNLADAGFWFDPTAEEKDNVTCFMCKKSLAHWTEDDDPFEVHWKKCHEFCSWATLRCSIHLDMDADGNLNITDPTRLPSSKTMEKARLKTFTSVWPHDSVKGHGANSKKMAKAGFSYNPQSPGDDTATCLYCDLSLNGWDAGDDPLEEHRKREIKSKTRCPFFTATVKSSLAKSTSKAPPTRKSSKPPSRSTSRNKIVEDTATSDDELYLAEPVAEIKPKGRTTRNTGSRTSTVPSKTPGSKKSTRSASTAKKSTASRAIVGSEMEDTEAASGSDAARHVSRSKKGRAKGPVEAITEEEQEDDPAYTSAHGGIESELEIIEKPKPKKGRPPKAASKQTKTKSKVVASGVDDTDVEPVTLKPSHSRTRSKAHIESESDAPPPPPRQTRALRQSSTVKAQQTQPSDHDDPKPVQPATIAVKKGKGKHRESSSASDDAGYATAEPHMEVDNATATKGSKVVEVASDEEQRAFRPVRTGSKRAGPLKSSATTKGKKKQLQVEVVVPTPPKLQNRDVEMADAEMVDAELEVVDEEPEVADAESETDTNGLLNDDISPALPVEKHSLQPPPSQLPEVVNTRHSEDEDDHAALDAPLSPTTFTPFLSMVPMTKLTSLTEEEAAMTVEQYIKREIELQYQQFKADAERKIEEFRERAAEARRMIEAS